MRDRLWEEEKKNLSTFRVCSSLQGFPTFFGLRTTFYQTIGGTRWEPPVVVTHKIKKCGCFTLLFFAPSNIFFFGQGFLSLLFFFVYSMLLFLSDVSILLDSRSHTEQLGSHHPF